ncbi:MAG: ABC transporter substrate-binding protein [Candidatus Bipolaricaulia bacterium]
MRLRKLVLCAVLCVVCLAGGALAQKAGGTLQMAVQAEPDGLCLITTAAAATFQLAMYNVYEPLLRYTADRELVPLLATSYEIEEIEGGARYTFHLRSGVTFHNGKPLTAADVKYTFDQLLDKANASPNAAPFSFLKEVVVVDDLTVQFVTSGKGAPLVGYLASSKGTGIIPQGAVLADLKTQPVGTGPFKLGEWVPGDHLTLVKNADYWQDGKPYLDSIVIRFISDQAASFAALLAGDLDLVDRMLAENAIQLESDPRFRVVSGPQNLAQLLAMNNARAPFDNLLVRQAIRYALNVTDIIAATDLKPEWGSPIGSHMCPLNPFYVDLVGMFPHDPSRAKTLLAQAGYPNGFECKLYLPSSYEFHVRTGEIIADQLKQVGITCKIELIEWGVWLDQVYAKRDYDLTVIGHDQGLEPAGNYKAFERVKADGSSDYYWQYTNAFVRDLLAKAKNTFDLAEMQNYYTIVQTYISDQAVCAWIQDPHILEGMRVGVMGYRILPIYVTDLAELWLED